MSMKEKIFSDIKDAMRAKEAHKLETLRMISAAIKQIEVDERIVVEDARLIAILEKLVKQRKESLEHFRAAGRVDLAEKEEAELCLIQTYLPPPLSGEAVTSLIEEAIEKLQACGIADMGKVIAEVKPLLQGQADMSKVSALIKTKLTSS